MGSARDGVGLEVRGRRVVAWELDDGRRSLLGARRVAARARALRVTVGRNVGLAVRGRRGWHRIGRAVEAPPWRTGPRVTLTARGRGTPAFDDLWIRPR
jgi:hypothetical protein